MTTSSTDRTKLRELYERGITGLDREPGDSLCYWAHGEIDSLSRKLAAALKERDEAREERTLAQIHLGDADCALAAIRAQLEEAKKEIAEYRNDIEGVLEHCEKYITLSNDFPWAEEVHCALDCLSKEYIRPFLSPELPADTGGDKSYPIDWVMDNHAGP